MILLIRTKKNRYGPTFFFLFVRKKRSLIWQYVKQCPDDPLSHECKLCKRILVANGNTSNSRRHMIENHNETWLKAVARDKGDDNDVFEFEGESDSNSSVPSQLLDVDTDDVAKGATNRRINKMGPKKLALKYSRPYGPTHPKKLKLEEDLCRLIAEDYEPYSVVEHPGFQRIVNRLDNRWVLPSRNTVALNLMPKLTHRIKDILIDRISKAR